jgi:hypothetical protein
MTYITLTKNPFLRHPNVYYIHMYSAPVIPPKTYAHTHTINYISSISSVIGSSVLQVIHTVSLPKNISVL